MKRLGITAFVGLSLAVLACSPKAPEEGASGTETGDGDGDAATDDTATGDGDGDTGDGDGDSTATGDGDGDSTATGDGDGDTGDGDGDTGDGDGDTGDGDGDTGDGDGDTGDGDGDTGDGDGDANQCLDNDAFEPNDLPEAPAALGWENNSQFYASVDIDAFLCANEDDWYALDASMLMLQDFSDFEEYTLFLDAWVQGSSWCGESCGDPFLPAAPENTMTIEVLDAETLEVLGSNTAANGRVNIGGGGAQFQAELLVRVYGPPEATYPYYLRFELRALNAEDECEC